MIEFEITPPNQAISTQLQHKIDYKTKPLGALGDLEKLAIQIGLIQQSLNPSLQNPHMVVFAADHGIAQEGVSAYPQEVTAQMVLNFVQGGAAINVFCKQHTLGLQVVDAGVAISFDESLPILHQKVNLGTKSFLHQKAMTEKELQQCLQRGAEIAKSIYEKGSNVIGFGEMGIGNTSSAAMLMHLLTEIPLEKCVGRGTGLDDQALQKKLKVLQNALLFHNNILRDPISVLQTFGGYEIAMMCGAMQQAAQHKMLILLDGFIASAAFLCAYQLNEAIKFYTIACHLSDEHGHKNLLNYLGIEPILSLNMRLGEGTGCALAYPIIENAVAFLNEMASFEDAGVSNKA